MSKTKSKKTAEDGFDLAGQIKASKVVLHRTDQLIPYARNARKHEPWQVAQIAASIKEFGFTNPVLIDETGEIVAGHGRVMAALKLDLPEVPCIVLGHLTPTQRKAYVLADNKLGLNSSWDADMLRLELEDLSHLDFDVALIGFEPESLDLQQIDYDVLEEGENVISDEMLDAMKGEVKRAIQVEFDLSDYDEAFSLVKYWRERGAYVGGLIIDHLRSEREKV